MKYLTKNIAVPFLALCSAWGALEAAEIEDIKVFSENDYARLVFNLDSPTEAAVEVNADEKLVFVRFDETGIENLGSQSFLYDNDPHIESVTFLPLGWGSTVARVKARHPFKVHTYDIQDPARFILEITDKKAAVAPEETTTSQTAPIDYFQRGLSWMKKGSYKTALMSFRSAIRASDRVADSYFQAGLIRYRLGELEKAAVNLHRAQESPRYSDTARLYLSWIYYRNGNHASMRREWKEFVKRLPDERSRIKLAAAHPEIDYRALEKAAAKRVENTPRHAALSQPTESSLQESAFKDSAAFYLQKGLKAGKQDRSREAARWLEKTVGFDPSCTQAWFQLGVIYKSLGKNDMSADCFEKSLGRDSRTRQRTSEKTEEEPIVLNNDETRDTNPLIGAQEERTPGGQESDGRATTTAVAAGTPGSSGAGTSTEWNPPAEKTDLEAPEVVNPLASTEENVFQTLRDVIAAGIVSKSDPGLLRKRIGLLTLILGTLFILTMLGEKLMFRKILPGRWFFSRKTAGTDPGRHGIGNVSSDHLIRKKKRQIEEVLTTQLAAKQQKNQHILAGPDATYHGWDNEKPGENSNIELEFQPVGHNGAYGADIARRIKEELLGATESTRMETTRGVLVRGKHDQQTRLIRQLRSKDWTIGDIAQEMSISREEVKWALANRPVSNVIQKKGNSEEVHRTSYGQAQGLFGGVLNGLRPGRTGRGVNSESQINP